MQVESAHISRDMHMLAQGGISAALVDVAPSGILAIDESGRVATVNVRAARLLGHACADIEGQNFIDLLRPSVRGDGMAWLRDVVRQGGFADVCALRADGALASLQLAVRAIRFDGRLMLACYLRETHRRRRGDPDTTIAAIKREQRVDAQDERVMVRAAAEPIVYVIDSDASIRASLTRMLQRCQCKVEAFAAAHSFLAHTRPCVPGCAILDVEGPDWDCFALPARLAADGATLPIILMASHGDVPTSVRAMKAGAFEFFVKPLSEHAVLTAIRDAIAFSASTLERARQRLALEARYVSLTPRERDVMRGVISGLLNKQVAAELGISEITVKAHRGRAMRKMQAHSLAELVNLGGALGLASSCPTRAFDTSP
ncbi:LuxR C-terminal-related transcriptional regulator [Lysobacter sp. P5_B9]